MHKWFAAVALLLASCGGSGDCAPRSGLYLAHTAERQPGTCGAIPDAILDFDVPPSGTCTVRPTTSTSCTVRTDETCTNNGVRSDIIGSVDWSEDGSVGSGILTVTVYGSNPCYSTYDVTYIRQ